MDSYGENRYTCKQGYFQNRGGFIRYNNGHNGKKTKHGATPHDILEKSAIETKAKLVPVQEHWTSAKAPVDKREETKDQSQINDPKVSEG